jgi:hypothetical protein
MGDPWLFGMVVLAGVGNLVWVGVLLSALWP